MHLHVELATKLRVVLRGSWLVGVLVGWFQQMKLA